MSVLRLILIVLALPPAVASAQVPGSAAEPSAEELRKQGAAAAARRNYEACVQSYSAALELGHSPSIAGELGLCEEALGRNVAAHDHLLEALAGEVPAAPPPAAAMWARYRRAAARVDRRIVRVLLLVSPPAATVLLDGHPLGSHVSGRSFAVLPGEHTWTARLPGFADATVTHTARAGDFPDIALFISGWSPPPPNLPAPPVAPPARPEPREPSDAVKGAGSSQGKQGVIAAPTWRNMDPNLVFLAGGLLSAGFTADVGPGFFVGAEAHFNRKEDWGFSVGADVRAALPTWTATRPKSGKPFEVSLIALSAAPCVRYRWVMGCAFIDPGISVGGGPPPLSAEKSFVLFMLGMGPRLAADILVTEHVGIRAFADLRFSPLRSDLGYRMDGELLWLHPPVSGFFGLGATFQ